MPDIIIVGGGPAGCSAAMTARMRGLNTLLLYAGGGALEKAERVDNYPGLPQISGRKLLSLMREQAKSAGAELRQALVQRIMEAGGGFSVLAGNDLYEAKCVILALGAGRVKPLPGEEAYLGNGVSYCATCDGMFYKGKRMAVLGSDGEAIREAAFLSELGDVSYYSEKPHSLSDLPASVHVMSEKPLEIIGDMRVRGLRTDKGEAEYDGIFILRPQVAIAQLMPELETERNGIRKDENLMASVPGVFIAGDLAGKPLQAAKAVGDGNRAALAAAEYIRSHS